MPLTTQFSELPHPGYSKKEHICTTVFQNSSTPSETERRRDAAHLLSTGRKMWRTLKGTGEAIWPPYVEAALLEGATLYTSSTRNKSISNYIWETTGKRRSESQVSSRLQALRKTGEKEKRRQSISQKKATKREKEKRSRSISQKQTTKRDVIYIEINLQNELQLSPCINFFNMGLTTPQLVQLPPHTLSPQDQLIHDPFVNPLSLFFGLVQFLSPFALMLESTFTIYAKGSHIPVHTESVLINCISSPTQSTGWFYSSDLVPDFWGNLCSSLDLGQYTIVQLLEQMNSDHIPLASNIALIYNFRTPAPYV